MATLTPLTAVFTPPPECLTGLYWSYQGPFQLGPDTRCVPSGLDPTRGAYFSPGIRCPESWTVACQSEITLGAFTETRAQCCPRADGIESFSDSSFSCNSVMPADSSLWKSWYESLGCTMNLGTLATKGYVTVVATGGTPYTTSVSFASDGGINAYSVQIAWQASDLVSETLTSISSSTAEPSTANSMSTAVPNNSDYGYGAGPHGLSLQTKVAIGVVFPVLAIVVLVWALLVSRRTMVNSRLKHMLRRRSVAHVEEPELQSAPTHELQGDVPTSELAAQEVKETNNTNEIQRLPASKEGILYA